MAAELCSLKAVEAQLERKATDAAYREKKVQNELQKAERDMVDLEKMT
jgi:hypothetical protein